jgi:hypothetical protein
MEVVSLFWLLFWVASNSSSFLCRSGARPFFSTAANAFNEIRTGLAILGLRYDTLFPDLEGLSHEFNYNFINRLSIRSRGIPSDEVPDELTANG